MGAVSGAFTLITNRSGLPSRLIKVRYQQPSGELAGGVTDRRLEGVVMFGGLSSGPGRDDTWAFVPIP